VIRCRAVGMLKMVDEAGSDEKIIAVPVSKVFPAYDSVKHLDDLPHLTKERIAHFFEHYKDLEKGKWVKLDGWAGADDARAEIVAAVARYDESPDKPNF
jgi:inorganic pyrophosphatase